jgi:hypothetical protein
VAEVVELAESHYSRPHWARATKETPVRIGNVPDAVVALVDHGSEMNRMSMDFYKKGKRPINTKHGWKIRAATRATTVGDGHEAEQSATLLLHSGEVLNVLSCRREEQI